MHTEYEVRVLEIDESKVTSIDVQGVFKKFYNRLNFAAKCLIVIF